MLEREGGGPSIESGQGGAEGRAAEAPSRVRRSGRRFTRAALLGLFGLVAASLVVATLAQRGRSVDVASSGEAAIGGPFSLVNTAGRPVDQHLLDGHWSAVFFGYTNCPDTCPATLQALNGAAQQLGSARRGFQVVFISVDPARDTPAQMKLYTDNQGYPAGGLIGLTGSPGQVRAVAAAYHAFYANSGPGPDYAVQHSAAIYLMDPRGRFVKPLEETQSPTVLAQEIKSAMGA